MTTTLRPSGPEEPAGEGGTSRAYEILDNGRRIGGLRLTAYARGAGAVSDLHVAPEERLRGRATIALLAAEEVLRGRGCRRIECGVPAEAAEALHLAAALGYRETGRHLVKPLAAAPRLPPGSRARPMTRDEYPRWVENGRVVHVELTRASGLSESEADEKYRAALARQLPDGPATEGARLLVLEHAEDAVGTLWVGMRGSPRPGLACWVWDVLVEPGHRGSGHGRSLMLAAEAECFAAGADRLGLNVHAGNIPALHLYYSLGYESVEVFHAKHLA
ncbi:GNAT family N-acetyltransferase [Streptomyces xiaopingdaonensis]|uniref:GNAT family N-acetyltransferase n=1 Tax=Streptomyces xiaopingdaonensis TaxID=1565415 RepID=UPI000316AC54|nr:GNAT family N-acetyltransferase [Streptomyces xiaopingdaonensis]